MLVVRADGFVAPCIPTLAVKPPAGPGWVHEVKHDGYRLIVRRDGETVRLFTRCPDRPGTHRRLAPQATGAFGGIVSTPPRDFAVCGTK
jgi:hypothetical protein